MRSDLEQLGAGRGHGDDVVIAGIRHEHAARGVDGQVRGVVVPARAGAGTTEGEQEPTGPVVLVDRVPAVDVAHVDVAVPGIDGDVVRCLVPSVLRDHRAQGRPALRVVLDPEVPVVAEDDRPVRHRVGAPRVQPGVPRAPDRADRGELQRRGMSRRGGNAEREQGRSEERNDSAAVDGSRFHVHRTFNIRRTMRPREPGMIRALHVPCIGAGEGNRTPDLLLTMEALCRLSYSGGLRDDSNVIRSASLLVLVLIAAACSVVYFFHRSRRWGGAGYVRPGRRAGALAVDVADTDAERAEGLMGVEELPPDDGMAFVFEAPTETSFWMR